VLKLSCQENQCKPLTCGTLREADVGKAVTLCGWVDKQRNMGGRGLHSSTFRLNVSAFCGMGGAFRGCLGGEWEVLGVRCGCLGCILCQKRLGLS
jgi:hypothetical protein